MIELRSAGITCCKNAGKERQMTWRLMMLTSLLVAAAVASAAWILNAGPVDHWLGVHTGTTNETGPYYGFWSGFGSDLTEFGVLGVISTGIYQLVKRYNCHEPGCWRVGTHAAAGGQFHLCYRHHPDFEGKKPTHELIARLHQEHTERQAAIHNKLATIVQR
jgi:hypothetical protein